MFFNRKVKIRLLDNLYKGDLLKKILLLMFMGIFLFGCIGMSESQPVVEEDVEEDVYVPPVQVEKSIPKIRFIDYPLELNAMEGARFIVEVKDAPDVGDNVFVYVWDEPSPSDQPPFGYVYSSYYIDSIENNQEHYETYIIIDEPGKYYVRALVVYDDSLYWSEEVTFNALTEDGKTVRNFNVEIGSSYLVPDNLNVNKGDIVVINFMAGEDSHSNGVRILSPGWNDSPVLKPGQSFTVEFTAQNSFSYNMFWLAGNLLRATGKVTVN
jgi:hypothetical protein